MLLPPAENAYATPGRLPTSVQRPVAVMSRAVLTWASLPHTVTSISAEAPFTLICPLDGIESGSPIVSWSSSAFTCV